MYALLLHKFSSRSGLEQEDMRIMYKYLTTSLFPAYMEQELQGTQNRAPTGVGHYGKWVFCFLFFMFLLLKQYIWQFWLQTKNFNACLFLLEHID